MKFSELVDQAGELLRRRERVTYRALKREFDLDDETLDDLKAELIDAQRVARDEEGKVLVWTGNNSPESSVQSLESESLRPLIPSPQTLDPRPSDSRLSAAERRQLTVMFCDLVGSTALSTQLDPEDYRAVVQGYQQTCADVIQRHDGYIAQYLGDGLLVYFGYPTAHEDDARRAVRAGLEIIAALQDRVPSPLVGEGQGEGASGNERKLQVRLGIHTGLVVVGDIGASGRTEQLALGETPNIAARIQGLAEPDTVIISAATQRLIEGQFECQPFGSHLLKGIDTPIAVYHVQSERQSVSPLASRATLTPLVGREQEVGLLFDRWQQAKEGRGQVVLLSGEPGIGKSRLAYTLREHVTSEGSLLYEARCSPYHQHSALYPLIDVLQRTLLLSRQDTDEEQVAKLERVLSLYDMQESLPLFIALLSLPTPAQYPPSNFTPQKQKERTLQAMLQLLIAQAERQATVSVWEDLHWADPSSLEFLSLLIDQLPTSKLLLVLTFRPEFMPPWKPRSHISQLVLNRLGQRQAEAMIAQAAAGGNLSPDVINQIRIKTDGVPLFVEELTKSVVESVGATHASPLQLAIPATLQEALMARLDRLSEARQVAQLGATLGREFSYELLLALAPVNESDLQAALTKLVEAEILYQRGVGQHTRYFFKHALIQDTAYQSLLKSTRQQYHQQIVQVLEERFPDIKANQPELLAHHYTEANLIERAIPYWQKAGEGADQRSAYVEAISHLTKRLELLKTLPDTSRRAQQELSLQVVLGSTLVFTKGYTAPEVERAYARALDLSQQVGESSQIFPLLLNSWGVHIQRGELRVARKLGIQALSLAQRTSSFNFLSQAYYALGSTLFYAGEFMLAQEHLDQGITLYEPQLGSDLTLFRLRGQDAKVTCLAISSLVLWLLGYPDQALKRSREALALARQLAHPFRLAWTLNWVAMFHQYCQDGQIVQERAEALLALSTEQGFPYWLALGTIWKGWALAEQRQVADGIIQLRQGMAAFRATDSELAWSYWLSLRTEAYLKEKRSEEGLNVLVEALAFVRRTGERLHETELYRLKGELTLQSQVESHKSKVEEAEACFFKAIEIAQKQQAKSLELRATTSLARLRQQQGKRSEAHKLLSDVYNWFTEGFDTKDLQEAKALIEELSD